MGNPNNKTVKKKSLNEMLRIMRKNAGLTQKDLAEHLNLTEAAISLYESGKNKISMERFQLIAKICEYEIVLIDPESGEYFEIVKK